MKIRYLGTAASEGWPAVFCQCDTCRQAARRGGKDLRFRACALIDEDLLLDASPDLYAARQKFDLDLGKVRSVLFTHAHSDHFNVHQLMWCAPNYAPVIQDRRPITLYGSRPTYEKYLQSLSLWEEDHLENSLEFKPLEAFEETPIGPDTFVTLFPARHGIAGASVYLVRRAGKRLLYLHDTGDVDEAVERALKGTHMDLVSVDATGAMQPAGDSPGGHMSFEWDIRLKRRFEAAGIAGERTKWVASHICIHGAQRDGKRYFHEDMARFMEPHGFIVAYDGLEIEV